MQPTTVGEWLPLLLTDGTPWGRKGPGGRARNLQGTWGEKGEGRRGKRGGEEGEEIYQL